MFGSRAQNRQSIWRIGAVVAIACVIAALIGFVADNSGIVENQCTLITSDSTVKTAESIEGSIDAAEKSIELTADLYGDALDEPVIRLSELNTLLSETPFDRLPVQGPLPYFCRPS